jgi:hypothetical protein
MNLDNSKCTKLNSRRNELKIRTLEIAWYLFISCIVQVKLTLFSPLDEGIVAISQRKGEPHDSGCNNSNCPSVPAAISVPALFDLSDREESCTLSHLSLHLIPISRYRSHWKLVDSR